MMMRTWTIVSMLPLSAGQGNDADLQGYASMNHSITPKSMHVTFCR
jgi:hypothetical protein